MDPAILASWAAAKSHRVVYKFACGRISRFSQRFGIYFAVAAVKFFDILSAPLWSIILTGMPREQASRSSTSAIISTLIEMCDIMLAAIERKWPTSLPPRSFRNKNSTQFCGSAFNVDFVLHPRRRYAATDRRVGWGHLAGSLPMPRTRGAA